jgi:ABC-type sulfate transport system permease component
MQATAKRVGIVVAETYLSSPFQAQLQKDVSRV